MSYKLLRQIDIKNTYIIYRFKPEPNFSILILTQNDFTNPLLNFCSTNANIITSYRSHHIVHTGRSCYQLLTKRYTMYQYLQTFSMKKNKTKLKRVTWIYSSCGFPKSNLKIISCRSFDSCKNDPGFYLPIPQVTSSHIYHLNGVNAFLSACCLLNSLPFFICTLACLQLKCMILELKRPHCTSETYATFSRGSILYGLIFGKLLTLSKFL